MKQLPMKKRCPKCHIDKLPSDFHKCVSRHDGLQAICAECSTIVRRKYYRKACVKQDYDYPISYSDIMSLEAHLINYPARMLDDMAG